jgi:opacity protein-like surface antigen
VLVVKSQFQRAIVITLLVAGATLGTAPRAGAQDDGGGYVSVGGSLSHRQRAGESATTYTDFKNGLGANIAAGFQRKAVAIEGEFTYFKNDGKTVASTATGPAAGLGSVSLKFFFANVRYTAGGSRARLYLGGGVGGYKSTLNGLTNTIANSFGFVANGTNDGIPFAYQARVGADFALSSRVALLAGYRYVRGGDLLFLGTAFGDLRPDGVKMQSAEVNLKFGF